VIAVATNFEVEMRVLGFHSGFRREGFHDRFDGGDVGVEGRPAFGPGALQLGLVLSMGLQGQAQGE